MIKKQRTLAVIACAGISIFNTISASVANSERLGEELLTATRNHENKRVRELLSRQANIHRTSLGRTALIFAVEANNKELVQILLDAGSKVNHKNTWGDAALHYACRNKNIEPEIIHALLNAKADINQLNQEGCSPLILAVLYKNCSTLKALINAGVHLEYTTPEGNTALILATSERFEAKGDLETIEALLQAGSNVNHANNDGDTPLIVALRQDFVKHSDNTDIVKALLRAGADITHTNHAGDTPLKIYMQAAASLNFTRSCELLFKPTSDDRQTIQPKFDKQQDAKAKEIIKLLIHAGVDIDHTNIKGQTALGLACAKRNRIAVPLLLKHGASPLSTDTITSLSPHNPSFASKMEELQIKISTKRCKALEQLCTYMDEVHNAPRDLQRLIIRDFLGTVPEQMPFQ